MTLDPGSEPPRVIVARGRERAGRSAYLCRRQVCLDRALHRKAFARSFRASVVVAEEEIARELSGVSPGESEKTGD